MEEHFGTQACVINLHNLIHFHFMRTSPGFLLQTTTGAHNLRELFQVTFGSLAAENICKKKSLYYLLPYKYNFPDKHHIIRL